MELRGFDRHEARKAGAGRIRRGDASDMVCVETGATIQLMGLLMTLRRTLSFYCRNVTKCRCDTPNAL